MKKILIVAVLLAVMLPLAAADKNGKWFVELGAGYDQPSGLDTVYAYAYGTTSVNGNYIVAQTQTYDVGTPRAWSPNYRVGYENDVWKGWISYYNFNKLGNSNITVPAGYETLFNTLPMPGSPFYYFDGFVYSDVAHADQKTQYTRWDFNIGRKFHPTEKWGLLFYTGVNYIRVQNDLRAVYGDTYDWNYWGEGSQDEVRQQSRSNGWGLNAGLVSSTRFNKWLSLNGGLEFSASHVSRNTNQSEFIYSTYYSPYYGAIGVWNSNNNDSKVLPAATVYLEGQVDVGEHFYGKMGYKFQTVQNAVSFSQRVNDYPYGGWGYVDSTKDLALDGLYFIVGIKF